MRELSNEKKLLNPVEEKVGGRVVPGMYPRDHPPHSCPKCVVRTRVSVFNRKKVFYSEIMTFPLFGVKIVFFHKINVITIV